MIMDKMKEDEEKALMKAKLISERRKKEEEERRERQKREEEERAVRATMKAKEELEKRADEMEGQVAHAYTTRHAGRLMKVACD